MLKTNCSNRRNVGNTTNPPFTDSPKLVDTHRHLKASDCATHPSTNQSNIHTNQTLQPGLGKAGHQADRGRGHPFAFLNTYWARNPARGAAPSDDGKVTGRMWRL